MIVRCKTKSISPPIEIMSPYDIFEQPVLDVGRDYIVFGIYIFPKTDIFIARVSFLIEVEPYLLTALPKEFFSMIDNSISSCWKYYENGEGRVSIHPPLFEESPHFAEDLFDGVAGERHRFDELRAHMS